MCARCGFMMPCGVAPKYYLMLRGCGKVSKHESLCGADLFQYVPRRTQYTLSLPQSAPHAQNRVANSVCFVVGMRGLLFAFGECACHAPFPFSFSAATLNMLLSCTRKSTWLMLRVCWRLKIENNSIAKLSTAESAPAIHIEHQSNVRAPM